MEKAELRSDCPINYALEYLGDKWTLLIIRDLIFEGKQFYKEFLTSKEGIATNILSDRLKKLEAQHIITSKVYEKQRTQKIYRLTQKGRDLIPLLVEAIIWSARYKEGLNVSDEFIAKLASNKQQVMNAIDAHIGTDMFSANRKQE
jgi:DNA-binding HxlR family transcriptional regulator